MPKQGLPSPVRWELGVPRPVWQSAIREFAYAAACRGEDIPGFKLVDKRATRKWKDEDALVALGVSPELLTKPALRSPSQIEKILGKKKFAKEFGDHVVKQPSGHTLVPVSDPRPPATVAQLTDFSVNVGNAETK